MKVVRKEGPGAKILKNVNTNFKNVSGSVGWYPSSKYPAQQPKNPDGKGTPSIPVAAIAAQNEFGNPLLGIPARPVMMPAIIQKEQEWKKISRYAATKMLKGALTAKEGLELVLIAAEGDIRENITTIESPALKPATVKARRRKMADGKTVGNLTKPWVETKLALTSLSHAVD